METDRGMSSGHRVCGKMRVAALATFLFSLLSSVQYAEGQPMDSVFILTMYGASIVSSFPGDPDGFGVGKLTMDKHTGSIIYDLRLANIGEPTRIFLFLGDYTTDAVQSCSRGNFFANAYTVTSPKFGQYRVQGAFPSAFLDDIISNPSNYFVEIFTHNFENGAIRSQLSRVNEGVRYQTSDYNLDNKP